MMSISPSADALQWAIEQADKNKPRNERDQVERNHIHELEQMRKTQERDHRAFRSPT